MSTKLIACLLAACVVAGGGAYLYHGDGGCPFSSGCDKSVAATCPSGECSLVKTGVCSEDESECCAMKVSTTAKKSCCSESGETLVKDPMTAAFGGLAVATK